MEDGKDNNEDVQWKTAKPKKRCQSKTFNKTKSQRQGQDFKLISGNTYIYLDDNCGLKEKKRTQKDFFFLMCKQTICVLIHFTLNLFSI